MVQEIRACIGCNECLLACPALSAADYAGRIEYRNAIGTDLTLSGPLCSHLLPVWCMRPPCPVGLHRDAMMLWLKVRLLRSAYEE